MRALLDQVALEQSYRSHGCDFLGLFWLRPLCWRESQTARTRLTPLARLPNIPSECRPPPLHPGSSWGALELNSNLGIQPADFAVLRDEQPKRSFRHSRFKGFSHMCGSI